MGASVMRWCEVTPGMGESAMAWLDIIPVWAGLPWRNGMSSWHGRVCYDTIDYHPIMGESAVTRCDVPVCVCHDAMGRYPSVGASVVTWWDVIPVWVSLRWLDRMSSRHVSVMTEWDIIPVCKCAMAWWDVISAWTSLPSHAETSTRCLSALTWWDVIPAGASLPWRGGTSSWCVCVCVWWRDGMSSWPFRDNRMLLMTMSSIDCATAVGKEKYILFVLLPRHPIKLYYLVLGYDGGETFLLFT